MNSAALRLLTPGIHDIERSESRAPSFESAVEDFSCRAKGSEGLQIFSATSVSSCKERAIPFLSTNSSPSSGNYMSRCRSS